MNSCSREWAHSLENEHQIAAELRETAPNRVAERSKTAPDQRITYRKNTNQNRTQQNDLKLKQNAIKRLETNAERNKSNQIVAQRHYLENELIL